MSPCLPHGFAPEEHVPIDRIIAFCDQHIRNGCILESSFPEKQSYIDTIADCGHDFLIWTPVSQWGWGISAFNLKCWRSPEGELLPILPE